MEKMNFLYFLLLVQFGNIFLYNEVEGLRVEKIINGPVSSVKRFRYVVAVIYEIENKPDMNPCAGGILSKLYVLTVAHCFYDQNLETYINKAFYVVASTVNVWFRLPTTMHILINLVIFPHYYEPIRVDRHATRGNLAVVKLSRSLPDTTDHNSLIKTLTVPGPRFIHETKTFTIAAFGWNAFLPALDAYQLFPKGLTDGKLRHASAHILTTTECQGALKDNIAEGNMCARIVQTDPDFPMGICQYDSGGPLVWKNYLKGIAISGFLDCDERNLPGIYINTTYYKDFIEDATSGAITREMKIIKLTWTTENEENQYKFVQYWPEIET